MTTPNRAAILTRLHKVLRKHYKPQTPPSDRSVLEHLLYACCLENARCEAADEAFAKLKELYFDWNEIRVTTVSELAEVMSGLPDAVAAGQRIKRGLQSVFETAYQFDLEAMRKQNLGKADKDLEKIQGTTPFVRAYVTQNALEGHSIPVNQGAMEVLYAVGVLTDHEIEKGQVPGLERAIPKNKGVEFGSLLHQIGADYYASPGSSKLKAILAEIDADYKDRLARRAARIDEVAQAAAAERAKKRAQARKAEARPPVPMSRPAPRSETKAAPAKPGTSPPEKAEGGETARLKPKDKAPPPAPPKKKDDPERPAKKEMAKGLAKKKPR
jgi:endonuclease-3